jgi:hypothetical protein
MSPKEQRLLRALALMSQQYISRNDALDHECISAGEDAIELLAEYGLVSPEGRGGVWTEEGRRLLAS